MNYAALAQQYQTALFNNVLPFWLSHSKDEKWGGYFTCLTREGKVFDSDKFIWLQARQVWTFAMLYNQVSQKQEWLDFALHGASFLQKHGQATNGNWYFSLNRQGQPLIQPYNIFSDCFAAMAFAQMYKATKNETYANLAKATFKNILARQHNPKGVYNKVVPNTRPLKNFALPMILCNLALDMEPLLDAAFVKRTIDDCIHEVMTIFYNEASGLILENVAKDGSFSDSFEGRLLNPGHAIEAMWFIMDLAERFNYPQLIEKATAISLRMLEKGWDNKHGGIFYFLDLKGHPPQQLEWDQKLWWVHLETLVALLKGFTLTGNEKCKTWFEKVHDYAWQHFRDEQHGEWFGYLNRQGKVLLDLKGGKWKGCFHVPRALYQCWKMLEKMAQ